MSAEITIEMQTHLKEVAEAKWWENTAKVLAYRLSVERAEPVAYVMAEDSTHIPGSKAAKELEEAQRCSYVISPGNPVKSTTRCLVVDAE